ncbi:MAG TPA: glycosyltransferase [Candidatus Faecimonas gallistercoris]|mgnify:CR=1 FL=1|nr:glycosyltransferase [Candidatus Faecimonas gallistercoris]
MKKVTILSLHLGYGGIEKSITGLANILCEKYEVEIICIYKLYEKPAFFIDERVKITYLIESDISLRLAKYKLLLFKGHFIQLTKKLTEDYFSKLKFISFIKDGISGIFMYPKRFLVTKKAISENDADIMISTRTFLNEWLSGYGKSNVVKIGWEHNHHHNNEKYAVDVVRSSKKLDYFVLVSKDLKRYYTRKLRKYPCKCVYIPNLLDSIPKRLSPLKEKRLISVGRLSAEKGQLDLLRIFKHLLKRHPDWHLDIIGDGPEREKLEKYITTRQLQDNVTLHGFQSKEYIDKLLHKSSLYIMTSYTESFGIVLLEAMSHGIPCVAFSSAEGAREIITSGKNGYIIKNRNANAMIKKIEDLMKKDDVRKQMGKEARKTIKQYTKEVVQEDWYKLLEKKVKR